jgi:hypothetical protein
MHGWGSMPGGTRYFIPSCTAARLNLGPKQYRGLLKGLSGCQGDPSPPSNSEIGNGGVYLIAPIRHHGLLLDPLSELSTTLPDGSACGCVSGEVQTRVPTAVWSVLPAVLCWCFRVGPQPRPERDGETERQVRQLVPVPRHVSTTTGEAGCIPHPAPQGSPRRTRLR